MIIRLLSHLVSAFAVTFHTSSPVRSLHRDGATRRETPVPRPWLVSSCFASDATLHGKITVPGHESSPFRRSFDSELLAVLAPQRLVMLAWQQQPALPPLLARAVHPRPMLDLHSFLNLLGGVVLNRRLQIAVQCIGGSIPVL